MRTHWTVIAMLFCVTVGCSRSVPRGPELATDASIKELMDAMVDPSAEYLFENIVEIAVDKACESCHLRYWYPNDKRAREAAKADGVVD
jgi:cytochrome c556